MMVPQGIAIPVLPGDATLAMQQKKHVVEGLRPSFDHMDVGTTLCFFRCIEKFLRALII